MINYRSLTIHSLPRLALNETVKHRGEPHRVVEIVTSKAKSVRRLPRSRRPVLAIKLIPYDGGNILVKKTNERTGKVVIVQELAKYQGKAVTVTRKDLERYEARLNEARAEFRQIVRKVDEGYSHIKFRDATETRSTVKAICGPVIANRYARSQNRPINYIVNR